MDYQFDPEGWKQYNSPPPSDIDMTPHSPPKSKSKSKSPPKSDPFEAEYNELTDVISSNSPKLIKAASDIHLKTVKNIHNIPASNRTELQRKFLQKYHRLLVKLSDMQYKHTANIKILKHKIQEQTTHAKHLTDENKTLKNRIKAKLTELADPAQTKRNKTYITKLKRQVRENSEHYHTITTYIRRLKIQLTEQESTTF